MHFPRNLFFQKQITHYSDSVQQFMSTAEANKRPLAIFSFYNEFYFWKSFITKALGHHIRPHWYNEKDKKCKTYPIFQLCELGP